MAFFLYMIYEGQDYACMKVKNLKFFNSIKLQQKYQPSYKLSAEKRGDMLNAENRTSGSLS